MDGKITIHIKKLSPTMTIKDIANFIKDLLEKGRQGEEEITIETEIIKGEGL